MKRLLAAAAILCLTACSEDEVKLINTTGTWVGWSSGETVSADTAICGGSHAVGLMDRRDRTVFSLAHNRPSPVSGTLEVTFPGGVVASTSVSGNVVDVSNRSGVSSAEMMLTSEPERQACSQIPCSNGPAHNICNQVWAFDGGVVDKNLWDGTFRVTGADQQGVDFVVTGDFMVTR